MKRPISWADLERALVFRLATEAYAAGQRLPTCEQLAADFGVNKNTASKAYRSLVERGYLRTVRGRGTFVVRRPARVDSPQSVEDVTKLLNLVLQEAKLVGLSHAQFMELVGSAAAHAFGGPPLRVAFVECNQYESTTVSRALRQALHYPIEPLVLHEVRTDPGRVRARFDVLIVNLAHLQELEEALLQTRSGRGPEPEVVGLLLSPDPARLTEVARLPRGTRVGVVCDVLTSAQKLTGMVAAYNHGIVVTSCVTEPERDMRKLLRSVDVVVAGLSAAARVAEKDPHIPIIPITWDRLEERSVRELLEWLERRRPPMRPLLAAGATQ